MQPQPAGPRKETHRPFTPPSAHALSLVHAHSAGFEQLSLQEQVPAGAVCMHCALFGRWLSGTRPASVLPEPQLASAAKQRAQRMQQQIPDRIETVMAASRSSRQVICKFEATVESVPQPESAPDRGWISSEHRWVPSEFRGTGGSPIAMAARATTDRGRPGPGHGRARVCPAASGVERAMAAVLRETHARLAGFPKPIHDGSCRRRPGTCTLF